MWSKSMWLQQFLPEKSGEGAVLVMKRQQVVDICGHRAALSMPAGSWGYPPLAHDAV